jgi:hypothetical protein
MVVVDEDDAFLLLFRLAELRRAAAVFFGCDRNREASREEVEEEARIIVVCAVAVAVVVVVVIIIGYILCVVRIFSVCESDEKKRRGASTLSTTSKGEIHILNSLSLFSLSLFDPYSHSRNEEENATRR